MDTEGGLHRMLGRMSGHPIGDRDYVAYFENEHGDQLIFVREPDAQHGVLLHSDLAWKPKLVAGPPKIGPMAQELAPEVRRFLGDVPVVGDVILNPPEAMWLKACLAASERR
jgi:hypothetical protein